MNSGTNCALTDTLGLGLECLLGLRRTFVWSQQKINKLAKDADNVPVCKNSKEELCKIGKQSGTTLSPWSKQELMDNFSASLLLLEWEKWKTFTFTVEWLVTTSTGSTKKMQFFKKLIKNPCESSKRLLISPKTLMTLISHGSSIIICVSWVCSQMFTTIKDLSSNTVWTRTCNPSPRLIKDARRFHHGLL